MSVPENIEEAAYLANDIKEILHAEYILAEAGLNNFDSRGAHNQDEVRKLQGEMTQMIDTDLDNTRNSVTALSEAKDHLKGLMEYYTAALGDISNHLPNATQYEEAKQMAEELARQTENLEADFNQAVAIMELEKQAYMTARLNYEERIRNAIEKAKDAFKTGADNTLLVNREIDKLVQLAEHLAM